MPELAPTYQIGVHQVGQTIAWSIIFDVAIVAGALRFNKTAYDLHALMGWIMLILTYTFILYLLIPFSFNADVNWHLYAHGIYGCMLLGFAVLQVIGGLISRIFQQDKKIDMPNLKLLNRLHRFFGYFLGFSYKILLIYAWHFDSFPTMYAVITWEGVWIIAFILIKTLMPKLEAKIVDSQTQNFLCPEISDIRSLTKVTQNYIIFANYIYDARKLGKDHPGGYKVIELVKGREVDRFIYGMYSAELYPELPAYSHSAYSLQLVGNPIAKLVTPPTY